MTHLTRAAAVDLHQALYRNDANAVRSDVTLFLVSTASVSLVTRLLPTKTVHLEKNVVSILGDSFHSHVL